MKNYKKQVFAILIIVFWALAMNAQETKKFPAQLSFVYPLGTSGIHSSDYTYAFSLNALVGKTGGVNGFEMAGIINMSGYNVFGIQTAGIGNFVKGKVDGVQLAGIINTSSQVKGLQSAGIININNGEMTGFQMAGISNINVSSVTGIQSAGIFNTSGSFNGLQLGGIANINSGSVKGMQCAGIINASDSMNGVQMAGIVNIARTETKGAQIACVNITGKLKGLQLGVVNIVDTSESGVAVGVVNIYRKGMYKELELSFSDNSNIAVSYKMGIKQLYSIYTVGVNFLEENLWFAGIGLGHISKINDNWMFKPEVINQGYYSTFLSSNGTNISRVKLGFSYQYTENLGIYIAPEFSVAVHTHSSAFPEDRYKIASIRPFWSSSSSRTELRLGLNMGVSFGK